MGLSFDAAGRLADGQPAVEHTRRYVSAAHVLGYEHPDLTAHDGQVYQWYDAEAGLNLQVLDGDRAQLWAVVYAAEEALRVQRAQHGELDAAWAGSGADSAGQFLQRHGDAAAAVAAAVRAAAEGCDALADRLWRLIDDKVAAVADIDDRSGAHRAAWLAAAQTVTTGVGNRPAADELVEQQIKPYVDNDIRADWLTAMRSTRSAVAAAYDTAADAVTAAPAATFEIPGELGPRYQLPRSEPGRPLPGVVAPSPTTPAGADPFVRPEHPASAETGPDPENGPGADPPAPSDWDGPVGDAAGLPLGAGSSTGVGGLGGLIGRIVDAIGGLLGGRDDGVADPGLDDLSSGDPLDADDAEDDADDDNATQEVTDDEPDEQSGSEPDDDGTPAVTPDATPAGTGEPGPTDTGEPAVADTGEPAAPAGQEVIAAPEEPPAGSQDPQPDAATPCEIAADELPQAGQ